MATGHKAQVSALQLHWVDSTHAMVGFTVSYDDGSIENHLRPCTRATLPAITQELNRLREEYLHHDEEKIPTTGGNQ